MKCTQSLSSESFVVSVTRANGLRLPWFGIPSGKTFAVNSTYTSNVTTIGWVQDTTTPTSVAPFGYVVASKIVYDLDGLALDKDHIIKANEASPIELTATFSSDLKGGEQIYLYLPGFTSTQSSIKLQGWNYLGVSPGNHDGDQFSATWSQASSTITYTLDPLAPTIPGRTPLNITVTGGQINTHLRDPSQHQYHHG